MNATPVYTDHHPRWLRRRTSTYWWLAKRSYRAFILRELSSFFVAWAVVFLLMWIRAAAGGDARYEALLEWARRPAILLLNIVTLFFIAFHAVTWFNLAPQAMVVRAGGRQVPGSLIAGSNYLAWVIVSVLIAWAVLGG
jgi:fumarate reductase subunit C